MFVRSLMLLMVLLMMASGCGHSSDNPTPGDRVERLPRLPVVQPVRKRITRALQLAATVDALKKVELSARVPGVVRVLEDRMDIGRLVKAGEVLLTLEVPELVADRAHKMSLREQAEKQEKLAVATLNVTRREVEESTADTRRFNADIAYNRLRVARIRDLVRQRAQDAQVEQEAQRQYEVAEADLNSNRARTTKLEAKVDAALAELELARQRVHAADADLKRVDELIGFATVKAPFNGVITRRWVDPGAVIKDPGTPLLTLMQIDRVRVLIDVTQRDVPYINSRENNPNPDGKGDPVVVSMPLLKGVVKNGEFLGQVTRLGRSLDPVTRTMRAEIELNNYEGHLRPGMFGTASIVVEDRSNVVAVPASSLLRRGEGVVEVYHVANPKGTGYARKGILRRIPVVLGIDDGKEVEIVEGLQGDELIVQRASGVMQPDEVVLAVPPEVK